MTTKAYLYPDVKIGDVYVNKNIPGFTVFVTGLHSSSVTYRHLDSSSNLTSVAATYGFFHNTYKIDPSYGFYSDILKL